MNDPKVDVADDSLRLCEVKRWLKIAKANVSSSFTTELDGLIEWCDLKIKTGSARTEDGSSKMYHRVIFNPSISASCVNGMSVLTENSDEAQRILDAFGRLVCYAKDHGLMKSNDCSGVVERFENGAWTPESKV